jgi:hypothetical protein
MITTKVFSLSRTELARITSEEYIRKYWFFVAPVPIIGLIALLTTTGPLQVFGMLAVLWPFSIPARSVVITSKTSRLFTGGCHVEATPEEVVFIGEYRDMKRLRYAISTHRIQEAIPRRDLILLRMRLPGFAPIKVEAFESDADREAFLQLIGEAVNARLGGTDAE